MLCYPVWCRQVSQRQAVVYSGSCSCLLVGMVEVGRVGTRLIESTYATHRSQISRLLHAPGWRRARLAHLPPQGCFGHLAHSRFISLEHSDIYFDRSGWLLLMQLSDVAHHWPDFSRKTPQLQNSQPTLLPSRDNQREPLNITMRFVQLSVT